MIDFNQLDKVIHERGRLAIMSLMVTKSEWRFNDLKTELGMSDGNLITHLRTLAKAEYVTLNKEDLGDPKPVTMCRITKKGRKAYDKYLSLLESIIRNDSD